MRSASSRDGGGSLGCRVGGSLRILRILQETKNASYHPAANCHRLEACGATVRYLRAMLRTLVLLRTRCGCLEVMEEEQEGEGGMEESVWTLRHKKVKQ